MTNTLGDYDGKYMKIKFNADDNLSQMHQKNVIFAIVAIF